MGLVTDKISQILFADKNSRDGYKFVGRVVSLINLLLIDRCRLCTN